MLERRFNSELVVWAHDHLDRREVNPVATDHNLGVGVWNLFNEDDDVGHVNQPEYLMKRTRSPFMNLATVPHGRIQQKEEFLRTG